MVAVNTYWITAVCLIIGSQGYPYGENKVDTSDNDLQDQNTLLSSSTIPGQGTPKNYNVINEAGPNALPYNPGTGSYGPGVPPYVPGTYEPGPGFYRPPPGLYEPGTYSLSARPGSQYLGLGPYGPISPYGPAPGQNGPNPNQYGAGPIPYGPGQGLFVPGSGSIGPGQGLGGYQGIYGPLQGPAPGQGVGGLGQPSFGTGQGFPGPGQGAFVPTDPGRTFSGFGQNSFQGGENLAHRGGYQEHGY